jgi:hypothetical protein
LKKAPAKYRIFYYIILFILITGCGLKGNPITSSSVPDYQQVVKNMEAFSADGSVVLKWDFYDNSGIISNINIEKSEVGSAGNECKDCPRIFECISQISIKKPIPEDKELKSFSFTDKKVERGKIYNYRLMLCDDAGICQESSRTEVKLK